MFGVGPGGQVREGLEADDADDRIFKVGELSLFFWCEEDILAAEAVGFAEFWAWSSLAGVFAGPGRFCGSEKRTLPVEIDVCRALGSLTFEYHVAFDGDTKIRSEFQRKVREQGAFGNDLLIDGRDEGLQEAKAISTVCGSYWTRN